jgi:hypothetical protein
LKINPHFGGGFYIKKSKGLPPSVLSISLSTIDALENIVIPLLNVPLE